MKRVLLHVVYLSVPFLSAAVSETGYFVADIGLYDSIGQTIFESAPDTTQWGPGPTQYGKVIHTYSLCTQDTTSDCDGTSNYIGGSANWNAAGGNNLFNYLETVQFIIPHETASKIASIGFTIKTPASPKYRVLREGDRINDLGDDFTSQAWGGVAPAATLDYPVAGSSAGDPIHLSILPVASNGTVDGHQVLGMFISFREPAPPTCDPTSAHCCFLDKGDSLWAKDFVDTENNCRIETPHYQCWQTDGSPWTTGSTVSSMAFVGSLYNMADGKPITIFLDDEADIALPLTNSFVYITPSSGLDSCATLCGLSTGAIPWSDSTWSSAASSCEISGASVFAADGLGPLTITGFGRISGYTLLDNGANYFGQQVWKDFSGTNCAGASYSSEVFGDHYKAWEWGIMSGLLEITTSDASTDFAVDIRGITVAWAPKRGDGAILINAGYRPLSDSADSNRPARLTDVKTPGGWMDAADGPNLLGDGSVISFAYLHHADDLLKLSASNVKYTHITALQGNVGSVVELGNYGLGLRNKQVVGSSVHGLYVHRIVHANGGWDGNGGVFGSRTCPNGITFKDITVNDLVIPGFSGANTVGQLFAIGTLSGSAAFCGGSNGDNIFDSFTFLRWRIYLNPSMYSKFFNADNSKTSTGDKIFFSDPAQTTQSAILQSAVQIYDDTGYYCVCPMLSDASGCWDNNGPGNGAQNFQFYNMPVTNMEFPYTTPATQNSHSAPKWTVT